MSILDSLTGGNAGDAAKSPLELIGGLLSRAGGVQGLVNTLQQGGLGEAVRSWVSTGVNQAVNGQQLGQALAGTDAGQHIEEMAQKLGVDPSQVLNELSQALPQAIDHVTPNGQVPSGSGFDLGGLAAKFGF